MPAITAQKSAQLSHENKVVLVDVRSPSAWLNGVPKHAEMWSEATLSEQAETLNKAGKMVHIICYRGHSSAQLAATLSRQWGAGFYSVEGGFAAWEALNLPIVMPNSVPDLNRYERQIKMPGFGAAAQQKLQDSHVLVVGAGGLGAPTLLYLAASGVGQITVMDDDTIALHNLHRQVLYNQSDVGQSKVHVAKQRLGALNDDVQVHAINQRLTADNVNACLQGIDLVVDGCDNITGRYVINDACLTFNVPWLFAAVSGFEIQLALFSGDKHQPCYRCLFPAMNDADIGNCSDAGILGPVPGLAGVLQATEAIKYLAQLGGCLEQKMLSYDVLRHQFKVLKYPANVNALCTH